MNSEMDSSLSSLSGLLGLLFLCGVKETCGIDDWRQEGDGQKKLKIHTGNSEKKSLSKGVVKFGHHCFAKRDADNFHGSQLAPHVFYLLLFLCHYVY